MEEAKAALAWPEATNRELGMLLSLMPMILCRACLVMQLYFCQMLK